MKESEMADIVGYEGVYAVTTNLLDSMRSVDHYGYLAFAIAAPVAFTVMALTFFV